MEGTAPRHGVGGTRHLLCTTSPKALCRGRPRCHPECHPECWQGPKWVTALLAVSAVLPESRHLHFDCGVTVQLGFAAEFSNIMIIYTRILAAPGDITECVAKLTDLPEVGWHPRRGSTLGRGVPRCRSPA